MVNKAEKNSLLQSEDLTRASFQSAESDDNAPLKSHTTHDRVATEYDNDLVKR